MEGIQNWLTLKMANQPVKHAKNKMQPHLLIEGDKTTAGVKGTQCMGQSINSVARSFEQHVIELKKK
jgi:hypothetical protein